MYIKKNFTQVPNSLISSKEISDGEFRTMVAIISFKYGDNKIFPSIETIAKTRCKGKSTISEHTKKLKKLGYLRTKKRGYSMTNEYDVIVPTNEDTGDGFTPAIDRSNISITIAQLSQKLDANNTEDNKTNKEYDSKISEEKKNEIRKKLPWLDKRKLGGLK